MTEEEIFNYLIERGAKLGAPYHNGEQPYALRYTASETGWEVLWEFGYCQAAEELQKSGEKQTLISNQMTRLKSYLGITELQDVVALPKSLLHKLKADFDKTLPNEKPLDILRLDERLIKSITELRVEMYTDESKHRGRPHVAVYLKNGKISISLEDPPVNLTPSGGLVGEASALKVIEKNRDKLLKIWNETRADTQKLDNKN